jgi:hypothetical protein
MLLFPKQSAPDSYSDHDSESNAHVEAAGVFADCHALTRSARWSDGIEEEGGRSYRRHVGRSSADEGGNAGDEDEESGGGKLYDWRVIVGEGVEEARTAALWGLEGHSPSTFIHDVDGCMDREARDKASPALSILMDGGVEAVSEKVSLGHHLVSTEKKKPDKHLYSHHRPLRIHALTGA